MQRFNTASEESLAPELEWTLLFEALGVDLLSRPLGISPSGVWRYKSASRDTPDATAARLRFLSAIVGDLNGAYNKIGVRHWFDRKRTQLDGRAPSGLLKGRWDPREPGPRRVRDLARASTGTPAT